MPCNNMDEWATYEHAYKLPDATKKTYPCKTTKNTWLFSADGELRQIQWRRIHRATKSPYDSPSRPTLSPTPQQ